MDFSSLLELLVGFNFALVASGAFLKDLTNVFTHTTACVKEHEYTIAIKNAQRKLIDNLLTQHKKSNEIFTDILGSFGDLEKRRLEWFMKFQKSIHLAGSSLIIKKFSLIGGTQAALFLFLVGLFEKNKNGIINSINGFPDGFKEWLIFLNIALLIFTNIFNFNSKSSEWSIRRFSFWTYASSLVISLLAWIIFELIQNKPKILTDTECFKITAISFVMVAGMHFIVFVVLSIFRYNQISVNYLKEIKDIKEGFEGLNTELVVSQRLSQKFQFLANEGINSQSSQD